MRRVWISVAGVALTFWLCGTAQADLSERQSHNSARAQSALLLGGGFQSVGSASGSITNVGPADSGSLNATYTSQSSYCTDYGHCGWWPHAVQQEANQACYEYQDGDGRLTYVGEYNESSGSQGPTTDTFYPKHDPVKVCLYVNHSQRRYLVAEAVYDIPDSGPQQPAQPQTPPPTGPAPECSDGQDNDGDGTVDTVEDYGCRNDSDSSERLTEGDLPALTIAEAKKYVRIAFKRRFRRNYVHGYAKRFSCSRRSLIRARCRTSWVIGDISFRGHVTIWYSRHGEDVAWNYAYKITRTNEYCVFALKKPKKKCQKVYRVR